jgi:hypothetical protein
MKAGFIVVAMHDLRNSADSGAYLNNQSDSSKKRFEILPECD